jgi:phage gp36-like protein
MWITPTATDLLAAIGDDAIATLAAKGSDNTTDRMAQCMTNATNEVLSHVRRSGCVMGLAGMIPQEALTHWAFIAAANWYRLYDIEMAKPRKESVDAANAWLAKLAKNEVNVVGYGADETTRGGQQPSIRPRRRTFGPRHEDGI